MSVGAGDTPPRVELPRPATGGAISPTPPDTGSHAWPRAPRFRRCFAAIPASHLPVNALRPRSRPDYRTARVTSRRHRRCSSVRSPAGVARRHHGGRPATRHPHRASLLRCRCGRPAAVFTSPVWQPPPLRVERLPPDTATGSHSRRVLRTPYRLRNRPAAQRFGKTLTRRMCGRPCRRRDCPSVSQASRTGQRGVASGPVRSPPLVCRSGVSSASAPDAASRAPCVPVRTPPHFTSPVWQPPSILPSACHEHGHGLTLAARACARHTGSGTGPPPSVSGKRSPGACAAGLAGRCRPLRLPAAARIRTATVPAASLPQRHHGGRPATRHPHRASLLRCRVAGPPPFPHPRCGSRRQSCRAPATTPGAGGGSRAAGARALHADKRPSPHARRQCRLPPRRARPTTM